MCSNNVKLDVYGCSGRYNGVPDPYVANVLNNYQQMMNRGFPQGKRPMSCPPTLTIMRKASQFCRTPKRPTSDDMSFSKLAGCPQIRDYKQMQKRPPMAAVPHGLGKKSSAKKEVTSDAMKDGRASSFSKNTVPPITSGVKTELGTKEHKSEVKAKLRDSASAKSTLPEIPEGADVEDIAAHIEHLKKEIERLSVQLHESDRRNITIASKQWTQIPFADKLAASEPLLGHKPSISNARRSSYTQQALSGQSFELSAHNYNCLDDHADTKVNECKCVSCKSTPVASKNALYPKTSVEERKCVCDRISQIDTKPKQTGEPCIRFEMPNKAFCGCPLQPYNSILLDRCPVGTTNRSAAAMFAEIQHNKAQIFKQVEAFGHDGFYVPDHENVDPDIVKYKYFDKEINAKKYAMLNNSLIYVVNYSRGKQDEEKKSNAAEDYIEFATALTKDIIRHGTFSDNAIQNIVRKHVYRNQNKLDVEKMFDQVHFIANILNVKMNWSDLIKDDAWRQCGDKSLGSCLTCLYPQLPKKVVSEEDPKPISRLSLNKKSFTELSVTESSIGLMAYDNKSVLSFIAQSKHSLDGWEVPDSVTATHGKRTQSNDNVNLKNATTKKIKNDRKKASLEKKKRNSAKKLPVSPYAPQYVLKPKRNTKVKQTNRKPKELNVTDNEVTENDKRPTKSDYNSLLIELVALKNTSLNVSNTSLKELGSTKLSKERERFIKAFRKRPTASEHSKYDTYNNGNINVIYLPTGGFKNECPTFKKIITKDVKH